jgi:acyl carrier protein
VHDRLQKIIDERRAVVCRVKEILIDRLQLDLRLDEIAEDSALFGFGLGLDSIDALTLIVAVEDSFGVTVPDDNLHIFRSINTIADFILQRQESNNVA